jgi:hypothetical protein
VKVLVSMKRKNRFEFIDCRNSSKFDSSIWTVQFTNQQFKEKEKALNTISTQFSGILNKID